ncbi:unnamed protein product [Adineta steineri]|uniref:Uncharacterized protein n=1 Tax=Adineta steineri TaxID=433720 RepID=A0A813QCI3_9BILA|nr:unnamed protein product [Adineta steineri]CAF3520470.1 unnamed protein product [Adineta steineri]
MNKILSDSNPSLITAGLPSSSIIESQLKHNQHINQNQANDTQPIIFNSQHDNSSQYTTLSNRTLSDTYLNISSKDMKDIMTALHTLAKYIQYDVDNKDHYVTMLHSKSTNHTLKSSTQPNNSFYHYHRSSIQNRRHSLSSDHHHHHHIKHHHRNLVEEFQHDLYDMKRKQREHQILRQLQYHKNLSSYPSYSSNAMLYTTSTCKSNIRPRQIYHYSRHHQSTIKTYSQDQYQQSIKKIRSSSSIPLSSYIILDKFIYIDKNDSNLNIQILPQQAHTLQILQTNYIHSFLSLNSLNLNQNDVATQWSLQMPIDVSKSLQLHPIRTNSNISTQSITVIPELTKNITEEFLTTFNLPISCNKRSRHYTSRTNQKIKRSRTQSNSDRLITIIQPYNLKEDSSLDFFDIDTTFSDTYDRLFTDITTSAKSLFNRKYID